MNLNYYIGEIYFYLTIGIEYIIDTLIKYGVKSSSLPKKLVILVDTRW